MSQSAPLANDNLNPKANTTNTTTNENKDMTKLTPSEILAQMAALQKQVFELQAVNEKLKTQGEQRITVQKSEKGGISVYGIQRFPVTLYQDQWNKLFGVEELVKDFIKAHGREGDKTLAEKPPKVGRPAQSNGNH